ncbi:MAG: hypothetical protein K0Q68_2396 [Moraxellaceae bacterium]|jgi:hypothetical protein|nr:hypothetical protein [Moraxellaceae bacterium]
MSSHYVHRIKAADAAAHQRVTTILDELQKAVIRAKTPIGSAVSFVISAWGQEADGTFVVQFSPLAAARLPALTGMALLQAAQGLAAAAALRPEEAAC